MSADGSGGMGFWGFVFYLIIAAFIIYWMEYA
jgi:hypothetical protein